MTPEKIQNKNRLETKKTILKYLHTSKLSTQKDKNRNFIKPTHILRNIIK